jgi:hypothetical protein
MSKLTCFVSVKPHVQTLVPSKKQKNKPEKHFWAGGCSSVAHGFDPQQQKKKKKIKTFLPTVRL